jgi:molybdopterin converting factor small subunit
MPTVQFTANLARLTSAPAASVDGATVGAALNVVFGSNPLLRGYVLDDQGAVRRHVVIFVDGSPIHDREGLSDAVRPDSEIYVMQALSGG